MSDLNNIDELFKSSFSKQEYPFDEQNWEKALDAIKAEKSKKGTFLTPVRLNRSIAICLALFGISLLVFDLVTIHAPSDVNAVLSPIDDINENEQNQILEKNENGAYRSINEEENSTNTNANGFENNESEYGKSEVISKSELNGLSIEKPEKPNLVYNEEKSEEVGRESIIGRNEEIKELKHGDEEKGINGTKVFNENENEFEGQKDGNPIALNNNASNKVLIESNHEEDDGFLYADLVRDENKSKDISETESKVGEKEGDNSIALQGANEAAIGLEMSNNEDDFDNEVNSEALIDSNFTETKEKGPDIGFEMANSLDSFAKDSAAAALIANLDSTKSNFADSVLNKEENINMANEDDSFETLPATNKPIWFLGFNSRSNFNSKYLLTNSSDGWLQFRSENETLNNNFDFGLSLERNRKLDWTFGLSFGKVSENLTYNVEQTTYQKDTNYVLLNNNFNEFGERIWLIEERIDSLAVTGLNPVLQNQKVNTFNYLRFPVSVGYPFAFERFSFVPTIGVEYSFITNSSMFYVNKSLDQLTDENTGISRHGLSFSTQMRAEYHLNTYWKFAISAGVSSDRFGLKSLDDFEFRRRWFSIGLSYKLPF